MADHLYRTACGCTIDKTGSQNIICIHFNQLAAIPDKMVFGFQTTAISNNLAYLSSQGIVSVFNGLNKIPIRIVTLNVNQPVSVIVEVAANGTIFFCFRNAVTIRIVFEGFIAE